MEDGQKIEAVEKFYGGVIPDKEKLEKIAQEILGYGVC